MDLTALVTSIGVLAAAFGVTVPLVLERSALRRLERIDVIVSRAPRRGGENSLLRAARDRIAHRVALQVLGRRYRWARFMGVAALTAGVLYVALGLLLLQLPESDPATTWSILIFGIAFAVIGISAICLRTAARSSDLQALHDEHSLPPLEEDDLTAWLIGRIIRAPKRSRV